MQRYSNEKDFNYWLSRTSRLGAPTHVGPFGNCDGVEPDELDLARPEDIPGKLKLLQPNVIVNAAAYTAVDKAESEPEKAKLINGIAPGILAEEAKHLGAIFIHYSTDYVFDGTSPAPYHENSSTHPINIYGASKLKGEEAIQKAGGRFFIFRTSWVYGSRGKNFLLTMLKLAKERESLNIVNDQVGAPTWCRMIAEAISLILAKQQPELDDKWGVYNLTSSGQTSWLGFAEAIFKGAHSRWNGFRIPKITGIPSEAYPTPARRPKNSVLSPDKLQKAFDIRMPSWESSLNLCLDELNRNSQG